MGSRGQSSSSSQGIKISARGGGVGNGKEENTKKLWPSAFNTGERFQSEKIALDRFMSKHGGADKEYGVSIDKDGYAHRYVVGGKSSVNIAGKEGHTVIHNHPSGNSHFSGQDLKSWSQGLEKTLYAVSKNGYSRIEKGKNFNGDKFWKAINGKSFKSMKAYDNFLKKLQKDYDFKYSRKAD